MLTARQKASIKQLARDNSGYLKVKVKKAFRYHNRTYNVIIEVKGDVEHVIKNIKGKRYETDLGARMRALEEVLVIKKFIKGLEA